jgi:DnaK suppressor protein
MELAARLTGEVLMVPTRRALDRTVRDEFRQRLLAARQELLRTVTVTDEELATLEAPEPGAPIEDAAREQGLAILSRLQEQERRALDEIFIAYTKLGTGTFGTCEECGDDLPIARLRALPTARYCVGCQTRREGGAR